MIKKFLLLTAAVTLFLTQTQTQTQATIATTTSTTTTAAFVAVNKCTSSIASTSLKTKSSAAPLHQTHHHNNISFFHSHSIISKQHHKRQRPSTLLAMSSSSSPIESQQSPAVIVAGAGIIGLSTAYYLSTVHSIKTILIDPTGTIAPAASGKAGGFLALDWNDYSPLRSLTRRSFTLHAQLAETFGEKKIQYRRLTCANVAVNPAFGNVKPGGKKLEGVVVEWVDPDESQQTVSSVRLLGDERTIAQVHPKMLCDVLWKETQQAVEGCELIQGEVISPVHNEDDTNSFIGAKLADGTIVKGDALLYSCGPWTKFGTMMGVKYHSAIIPTPNVLTQSVFFAGCGDPEVYPRPDKTAYCTGFPDEAVKVTERPGEVEVREERIREIVDSVRRASSKNGEEEEGGALSAEPVLEQACYLPTTLDGLPLMGKLSSSSSYGGDGCFVAAGHGCWGILMGPATGEAMANMISQDISIEGKGGAKSVDKTSYQLDMSPFDPARYGL